jgi:hypothetical protein
MGAAEYKFMHSKILLICQPDCQIIRYSELSDGAYTDQSSYMC